MNIITYARNVGLQIYYEVSYLLCVLYTLTNKCKLPIVVLNFVYLIKKVNFVEQTSHHGRSQRASWSPYLIFILRHSSFCHVCKKVILWLSEHDDITIKIENADVFGYLSFILVPFRTLFSYFRSKNSGNPA